MKNKPYRASAIITEILKDGDIVIMLDAELIFGEFQTESHAEEIAKSVESATFTTKDGAPGHSSVSKTARHF